MSGISQFEYFLNYKRLALFPVVVSMLLAWLNSFGIGMSEMYDTSIDKLPLGLISSEDRKYIYEHAIALINAIGGRGLINVHAVDIHHSITDGNSRWDQKLETGGKKYTRICKHYQIGFLFLLYLIRKQRISASTASLCKLYSSHVDTSHVYLKCFWVSQIYFTMYFTTCLISLLVRARICSLEFYGVHRYDNIFRTTDLSYYFLVYSEIVPPTHPYTWVEALIDHPD